MFILRRISLELRVNIADQSGRSLIQIRIALCQNLEQPFLLIAINRRVIRILKRHVLYVVNDVRELDRLGPSVRAGTRCSPAG